LSGVSGKKIKAKRLVKKDDRVFGSGYASSDVMMRESQNPDDPREEEKLQKHGHN
jgi:hypothetical protein